MGIEDSIAERAAEGRPMPVVQIIVTVNEDFDNTEGTRLAGVLRREVLLTSPVAEDAGYDHTVNSLSVDTVSAISYEDAQEIRSAVRNALADEPYTIDGFSIQADIQAASL